CSAAIWAGASYLEHTAADGHRDEVKQELEVRGQGKAQGWHPLGEGDSSFSQGMPPLGFPSYTPLSVPAERGRSVTAGSSSQNCRRSSSQSVPSSCGAYAAVA